MFEKMNQKEIEEKLKTSAEKGLSVSEANRRLKLNGKNVLAEKKKDSAFKMFVTQLNDPMIYILIGAVIISLILKEFADVMIILAVITINGIVGVIQESKAEKALEALKNMTHSVCNVKRDGKLMAVNTEDLVVGDVVELEAGQKVPADIRLVESKKMKIVESSLTGESVPSSKNAEKTYDKKIALGDKENMAFMSTSVVNGRGVGIVVATGMNTEIGKIAGMLKKKESELTPLQKKLASLGKFLGIITIALCLFLLVIGVAQKRNLYTMLLTSISLAVAAIPEGLPAVVTIVLSLGVQRMAKLNTIARKLSSVETLGAVTVVCSDKTGTLTQNKMNVEMVWENNKMFEIGEASCSNFLIEGLILCNDADCSKDMELGDPTEIALIQMGQKLGYDKKLVEQKWKRVDEMPFDSNRKMMSTLHARNDVYRMYTKGAVEEVLKKSEKIFLDGKVVILSPETKTKIKELSREMARQALRVIALSYKEAQSLEEESLVFVGMVGMKDPIRPEAKNAVKVFEKAGIKTVMITGDHVETAFSIAKELGIAYEDSQCISGEKIDLMSMEELCENINRYRVFARVSPENKVDVVSALKTNGEIVAMTGDGVNDAPSLRKADVGIAMGCIGTDVAKEASDMILNDDNFASIEKAVEEGRVIYSNIRKSVLFLLSSNLAEIITMLLAIILKSPVPLLAIHILWINLITDSIPALALGGDNKESEVMDVPPRKKDESLFANGGLKITLFYGGLIGGLCLISFFCVPLSELVKFGEEVSYGQIVRLLTHNSDVLRKAQTFSFVTLATCELAHALIMRNTDKSFARMDVFKNKLMILAIGLGVFLQWMIIEIPFMNKMFKTSNLLLGEWCFAVGCSLVVLAVHELVMLCKKK